MSPQTSAIAAFHARRYVPKSVVVAAAGSVDHDQIVELAERTLGGDRAGEVGPVPDPAPGDPRSTVRFLRKDTEQTHVCLGATGIDRCDDRRFAVRVLDAIFGGLSSSRLFQAVREERGLDPRDAEVLVGTSAGSVLAGFLGCGIGVDVLLDHQRGIVNAEAPDISYDPDRDAGGALPPLPRPGIGSARGVLSTALRPWRVTPMGALSSVLPQGRGSLAPIGTRTSEKPAPTPGANRSAISLARSWLGMRASTTAAESVMAPPTPAQG